MPRLKQFNEDAVLQKAMCIFWKNGYHATSIQDLVNGLGINRASLYDTFGGKRALFDKTIQQYITENNTNIAKFLASQPSVKAGFRALFTMAIDEAICDADRKGCFVVNVTTELVPGDDEIQRLLDANRLSFEKLFFDYLSTGVERGEISSEKDLKSIARLLFTLHGGTMVIAKVNPDREKLLATVDTALLLLD